MSRPIRPYRGLALALSLAVLGWQALNLALGRLVHEFLLADLAASALLLASARVRDERVAAVGMLAGFATFAGVFLAATTGKLLVGGGHPGTLAAALGLAPCLAGAIGLGRRLAADR